MSSCLDLYLFGDPAGMTLFNETLRVNNIILAQETFIIFLALMLLITYNSYNFRPEFF